MLLNRGRLYQHNECVGVILWGFYAPHHHQPSTINLICIFCSSNKHSESIFWLNCYIHSESRNCNYYCKSFFVFFCQKQRCSACAFGRLKCAVAIINKFTVPKPLCKYLGIRFIAAGAVSLSNVAVELWNEELLYCSTCWDFFFLPVSKSHIYFQETGYFDISAFPIACLRMFMWHLKVLYTCLKYNLKQTQVCLKFQNRIFFLH